MGIHLDLDPDLDPDLDTDPDLDLDPDRRARTFSLASLAAGYDGEWVLEAV